MNLLVYRPTEGTSIPLSRRRVRVKRTTVRMGELNWLALLLLAAIVLLFDAIVIGRHVGLISLPGEMRPVDLARSGALAYLSGLAVEGQGDDDSEAALAGLDWQEALRAARTVDDVGRQYASAVVELSGLADADRSRRAEARLHELVEADPRVKAYSRDSSAYVLVTPHGTSSTVQDRQNALARATLSAIENDPVIARATEAFELIITAGSVSFEPGEPAVQAAALSTEIAQLRADVIHAMAEAGLTEMEGEGLVVTAYDAPQAWSFQEIVHERDVEDVLNAAFAAGATGAQVGGERIVATSSVRCIGPVVLVNQRPVAVNPVKILIIGEQDALLKALEPLADRFARSGKILEFRREALLRLDAFIRVVQ